MKKLIVALAPFVLLAATAARADTSAQMLGEPAAAADATRTIEITSATSHVNVSRGDVVRFEANGREFAYRFDTAPDVSSFDLRRIAPAGALDHPVTAYVAPDALDDVGSQ
jgi:hypothetical protein